MFLVRIPFKERMVKCMLKRRLSEQFTHRQRFKPSVTTACMMFLPLRKFQLMLPPQEASRLIRYIFVNVK
jgi:hypothetical protein